jgi:hypothetical protein
METGEQRKHARIDSINLSYVCLDKSEKVVQQAMARTINISQGGILFETHFKMEKEYTLIATIGIRDETVDLKGKIIHVESVAGGKYVAGVEITNIKSGDELLWKKFIKEFSDDKNDSSAEK